MPLRWLRYLGTNLAIAAVYFGAAKLGLSMADPNVAEQVTIVWPPTGIALFVFLVLGYRLWPGIALGAFLANVTAHESVLTACLIALGNTLEGVLGAWLLRAFRFDSLERLKDVVGLVVLAAGLSTTVSATIGVTSLCLGGKEWEYFGRMWLIWWFGDAMGNLAMAPVLLTWLRPPAPRWELSRLVEGAGLSLSFILLGQFVFGGEFTTGFKNYPLEYTVFPFVIWAALRFGQYGATAITFMASVIAVTGTLAGCGPFAKGSALESLFLLQIFMGVVAVTGLVLAAVTTERRVGERRLAAELEAITRLHALSARLLSADNLSAALDDVLENAIVTSGADFGNIQLYNPQAGGLEIVAQRGFRQEFLDHFRLVRLREGSACAQAMQRGERIVIEDVELDPTYEPHRYIAAATGYRAVQSTPIKSCAGTILGMLSTHFRRPQRVSDRNQRLLDLYARHAADLIERIRTEQGLKEADRRKDEFLAMLAHELRNPLAPLRNALQILQTTAADPALHKMAQEVMDRQTQQLARLVDDLMDVSRITRGKIQLHPETIELATVVKRAVEIARPLIEGQEHQFTVSLPREPAFLRGDLVRLAQALANILNNAAKYTPKRGRISLTAERSQADVLIRVRDNGIGIAPEVLPHIFDLFTQADRSLDRAQGGLGIGLTLVRTLVEMHGGSVQASSAGLAQGSEFVVRLAALPAPPSNGKSPDGQPVQIDDRLGRRVLIVDDNRDTTQTLASLMRLWNHQVQTAHDGSSALALAESFQPDVVFLDVGLPGMNGFEVAKQLRRLTDHRSLLLVALSGYGQDEDRSRAREAGIDHYLVKPVLPEVLRDFLVTGANVPAN